MRAFILVDDADSMSEFSDELVILLTEPEEENEDFSSVLSSLPSLSSVYNKNENESKCVGIVFGDRFIPTKPKAGKEWMKKSVWGEAGMDKESKEMEEMIMKAIQEEKARMKEEAKARAMKIVKEEEARMEEEETEMDMKRQKIDEKEEVREAEKEVEVKEERVPEETKKEEEVKTEIDVMTKEEETKKKEEVNTKEEKTDVKEESMEERTTEEETKEEEVKTEIEVKTTEEEEASAEKEPTQTEETEEAVVASEAKNPPTVSQNEEPNSFAAVNEETKTDEAEEGLPVQTEEQSKELLRDCLGTIRQQINGVTVTLGLRMGDLASTCTLVVCRKGAYEKFFNMQKDDVPFTVRFMDKRYPFSVGVESSMKEVRQRAISVSSTSSLDE